MVESMPEVQIEECLGVGALVIVIMNFLINGIEDYGSLVNTLEQKEYRSKQKKLGLDMKHDKSPPATPSI